MERKVGVSGRFIQTGPMSGLNFYSHYFMSSFIHLETNSLRLIGRLFIFAPNHHGILQYCQGSILAVILVNILMVYDIVTNIPVIIWRALASICSDTFHFKH